MSPRHCRCMLTPAGVVPAPVGGEANLVLSAGVVPTLAGEEANLVLSAGVVPTLAGEEAKLVLSGQTREPLGSLSLLTALRVMQTPVEKKQTWSSLGGRGKLWALFPC